MHPILIDARLPSEAPTTWPLTFLHAVNTVNACKMSKTARGTVLQKLAAIQARLRAEDAMAFGRAENHPDDQYLPGVGRHVFAYPEEFPELTLEQVKLHHRLTEETGAGAWAPMSGEKGMCAPDITEDGVLTSRVWVHLTAIDEAIEAAEGDAKEQAESCIAFYDRWCRTSMHGFNSRWGCARAGHTAGLWYNVGWLKINRNNMQLGKLWPDVSGIKKARAAPAKPPKTEPAPKIKTEAARKTREAKKPAIVEPETEPEELSEEEAPTETAAQVTARVRAELLARGATRAGLKRKLSPVSAALAEFGGMPSLPLQMPQPSPLARYGLEYPTLQHRPGARMQLPQVPPRSVPSTPTEMLQSQIAELQRQLAMAQGGTMLTEQSVGAYADFMLSVIKGTRTLGLGAYEPERHATLGMFREMATAEYIEWRNAHADAFPNPAGHLWDMSVVVD